MNFSQKARPGASSEEIHAACLTMLDTMCGGYPLIDEVQREVSRKDPKSARAFCRELPIIDVERPSAVKPAPTPVLPKREFVSSSSSSESDAETFIQMAVSKPAEKAVPQLPKRPDTHLSNRSTLVFKTSGESI